MEFLAKFRELIETIQLMLGETFEKEDNISNTPFDSKVVFQMMFSYLLSIPNYLRKAILPQLTAKSNESPTIDAINDHAIYICLYKQI